MHPVPIEKTFRISVAVLGTGFFLFGIFFFIWMSPSFHRGFSLGKKTIADQAATALFIPLETPKTAFPIPVSHLANEMAFFLTRLRPGEEGISKVACTLYLKKTGLSQTVFLPARLGLKYENQLRFADDPNSFWVDISEGRGSQIFAKVFVPDLEGNLAEVESFYSPFQQPPIRPIGERVGTAPFKALSESRLLGRDLFLDRYGGGDRSQRIEMGMQEGLSQIVLREGDFLAWIGERWKKIDLASEGDGFPLLRVERLEDQGIIFEAWDLAEYTRLSVSSSVPTPLKIRKEDFLTAVRIRSEKQISCMLEKQCFVLRSGDWILKEDSRWRVLRKPQERELFLQGHLVGEIFVFDQIDLKGGQKILQGSLFNRDRSQMVPIEMGLLLQGKNTVAKDAAAIKRRKGK